MHAEGAGPFVSVVVCTTGRRRSLDACLASLRAVEGDAHEVVVVENAPVSCLSREQLESWGARLVHEPRRGLDVARNRGFAETAGDVIAFVDDDCVLEEGWLDGFQRAFRDPTVGFATGRVRPLSLAHHSERRFEEWFGFDRGTEQLRFHGDDPEPGLRVLPYQLGTGCNMAFRRSALLEASGFDEALDMGTLIGGGGDLEMFARLLRSGVVGTYVPEARLRHAHRTSMRDLRWQFFGYGASQSAVVVKALTARGPSPRREAARVLRVLTARILVHLVRRLARRGGFSGQLLVPQLLGMAFGLIAYPLSRVQARVRRRRSISRGGPVCERAESARARGRRWSRGARGTRARGAA